MTCTHPVELDAGEGLGDCGADKVGVGVHGRSQQAQRVAPRWRGVLRPQQLAAGCIDVGEEEGASEIVALGEEGGKAGKLVLCGGGRAGGAGGAGGEAAGGGCRLNCRLQRLGSDQTAKGSSIDKPSSRGAAPCHPGQRTRGVGAEDGDVKGEGGGGLRRRLHLADVQAAVGAQGGGKHVVGHPPENGGSMRAGGNSSRHAEWGGRCPVAEAGTPPVPGAAPACCCQPASLQAWCKLLPKCMALTMAG